MDRMNHMVTLSQVLEKLRVKRQDNEYKISPEGLVGTNGKTYQPDELQIIKTFRFESESDPSDSSILYIIEAKDGLIGYSIDAYGVYSQHDDDGYDEFIKRVPIQDRDEQLIFA